MAEATDCSGLAATTVQERAEKLSWALARLPLPSDAEAAHDARVALRRLRAAATGFEDWLERPRKWRRRLRRAERELGRLRDAEVRLGLLDEILGPVAVFRDRSDDPRTAGDEILVLDEQSRIRPGLRGLEMEARRALADSTSAEIDGQREAVLADGGLQRLQRLTAPPRLRDHRPGLPPAALAEDQLPRLLQRAARSKPGAVDLHRRRTEIRRLRYRLELFAPALGEGHRAVLHELRDLQRLLGRFHDLVVLGQWLEDSSRQLRHELRPALRRLALRVQLEQQVAREAAETELARLDGAAWWDTVSAACLGQGGLGSDGPCLSQPS
ncbi:MAG TPA: CHAD domain-containing protein [Candidatus Dormibacteraeota bacterium]